MTAGEIDQAAAVAQDLIIVGAGFYPPLAPIVPLLKAFVVQQAAILKTGLANGSIVPDGRGGFVPASNSHFDPKTGEFL